MRWFGKNYSKVIRRVVCSRVLKVRLQHTRRVFIIFTSLFSPKIHQLLFAAGLACRWGTNQKRSGQPATPTSPPAPGPSLRHQSGKTLRLTEKHVLRTHNHTVITEAWLWNACTAERGTRTNKPLFLHQASHNKVSIIPTALALTQWKGPQAVIKQLRVCHIAEYSVTGLIAHLIQADVVSLSQCSAKRGSYTPAIVSFWIFGWFMSLSAC